MPAHRKRQKPERDELFKAVLAAEKFDYVVPLNGFEFYPALPRDVERLVQKLQRNFAGALVFRNLAEGQTRHARHGRKRRINRKLRPARAEKVFLDGDPSRTFEIFLDGSEPRAVAVHRAERKGHFFLF